MLLNESLAVPVKAGAGGKGSSPAKAGQSAEFQTAFAQAGKQKKQAAPEDGADTATKPSVTIELRAEKSAKSTADASRVMLPAKSAVDPVVAERAPPLSTDVEGVLAEGRIERNPLRGSTAVMDAGTSIARTIEKKEAASGQGDTDLSRSTERSPDRIGPDRVPERIADMPINLPERTIVAEPETGKPVPRQVSDDRANQLPAAMKETTLALSQMKRTTLAAPAAEDPSGSQSKLDLTDGDVLPVKLTKSERDAKDRIDARDLRDDKATSLSLLASPKDLSPDAGAAVLPDVGDAAALADGASAPTQLLGMLATQQIQAQTLPDTPTTGEFNLMSDFQAMVDRARARTASEPAAADKSTTNNAADDATGASETDTTFRFARADGKGKAISMSISTDGERASVKQEASGAAAGAKAETVTVLESRRFLGIAPTSNASAVTAALIGSPQFSDAMKLNGLVTLAQDQAATGKVVNTLKIQMHPIDLGMVTATLRLRDNELVIDLKVETGDAFRQLNEDQSEMIKALRAQGFAVDQVNVVFNGSDPSTSQQQQPEQNGRERATGERSNSGDAQRQTNGNGSGQTGSDRWSGRPQASGVAADGDLHGGDGVYI